MMRNGILRTRIFFADGIGRLKQFRDNGVPDDTDLAAGLDISLREEAAVAKTPVTNDQIVEPHAQQFARPPVRISVDYLAAAPHQRRRSEDGRAFGPDRVGVVGGDSRPRSPPMPDGAAMASRKDDNYVRAQRLELTLHQSARTLPDRDHRRHRRDPNHHAEHGQRRAHLVLPKSTDGDFQGDEGGHGKDEG